MVRRIRGWWDVDSAFPETVKLEKELDFLRTLKTTLGPHGSLAARADERIGVPDPEDEVAPEGLVVAGAALGRGGHGVGCGGIDSGVSPGGLRGRGICSSSADYFVASIE